LTLETFQQLTFHQKIDNILHQFMFPCFNIKIISTLEKNVRPKLSDSLLFEHKTATFE